MTITVGGTTITFNDSTTQSSGQQVAKAWVNFDGTTTPGTIRAQYNVSSVTRSATGIYTINFTNSLADTNFIGFYTTGQNSVNNNTSNTVYGQTVSSVTCAHWENNGNYNLSLNYVAVFR